MQDGSKLLRVVLSTKAKQDDRSRLKQALLEYSNMGTHYRFLARKYHIELHTIRRAVLRHDKENKLCAAHAEWLATYKPIQDIADKYDVSSTSLSLRITKGLKS